MSTTAYPRRHATADASNDLAATFPTSLEEELSAILRAAGLRGRQARAVATRLGWSGRGVTTLASAGEEEGYTRERVRQLEGRLRRHADASPLPLPLTATALRLVENAAPIARRDVPGRLALAGLSAAPFDLSGILSAAELGGLEVRVCERDGVVLRKGETELAGDVNAVATGLVARTAPVPSSCWPSISATIPRRRALSSTRRVTSSGSTTGVSGSSSGEPEPAHDPAPQDAVGGGLAQPGRCRRRPAARVPAGAPSPQRPAEGLRDDLVARGRRGADRDVEGRARRDAVPVQARAGGRANHARERPGADVLGRASTRRARGPQSEQRRPVPAPLARLRQGRPGPLRRARSRRRDSADRAGSLPAMPASATIGPPDTWLPSARCGSQPSWLSS